VKQDETIRSQKERKLVALNMTAFGSINRKVDQRRQPEPMAMSRRSILQPATSTNGCRQVLDSAHSIRPARHMDVGGVEIIGYDRETANTVSYLYDSRAILRNMKSLSTVHHDLEGQGHRLYRRPLPKR